MSHGPNPGRIAALHAAWEVEQGFHAEDVLAELAPPEGADRRLAWFLVLGSLRRRSTVDLSLDANLSTPIDELDPRLVLLLRLGAYERMFARTAAHAAVHEWVEIAKMNGLGRASGLANAVLRKIEPHNASQPVSHDHPPWLARRWRARYGEAADRWMAENSLEPPIFVVGRGGVRPEGTEPVLVGGVELRAVGLSHDEGRIDRREGFAEGRFWVQDPSAVRVADLIPAGTPRVIDACAAPGGKTFRLADRGMEVMAVDLYENRLDRLREGARRLGFTDRIHTACHDWTQDTGDGPSAEAVLVDAPCSGLGTLRRHPEIRWRRHEGELTELSNLQGQILSVTSRYVLPRGVLVYGVCSPEPEEGRMVVDRFLSRHKGWVLEEVLDTAPPEGGTDAHWAARLRAP